MRWLAALLSLPLVCAAAAEPWEVVDTSGKHWFTAVPTRVVATDWTLLENLQALGVPVLGAVEPAQFEQQTGNSLAHATANVGKRSAPSLREIRQLEPDLIVIGTGQKELIRPLRRITKVMYYKQFDSRYRTNGDKANLRFRQLAAVFKKTALAESLLQARDNRLRQWASALATNDRVPTVTLLRLNEDGSLSWFGPNSLPGHALTQLGLRQTLTLEATYWGERKLRWEQLADAQTGRIVIAAADHSVAALQQSPQWRALSESTQSQIQFIEPVWAYGGALSIGRIAESVAVALLPQGTADRE